VLPRAIIGAAAQWPPQPFLFPCFPINTKHLTKRKNVFVHTTKCLKAKNHIMFFIHQKNNVLACILTLITSLLKSREHWPKLQKKKKLFCLSFSIRGTTLHVIRIPDIKFFFLDVRTVRFYPIKIRTSLIRRAFLEY
jgi:hypothetical protein